MSKQGQQWVLRKFRPWTAGVALLLACLPASLPFAARTAGAQSAPAPPLATRQVPSADPLPLPGAPPAAPPSPIAAPSDASSSYIISTEDMLQIVVWKEPGFSGSAPVRPDGMISLALVGDIPAAGFTPAQLSQYIAFRLKKFVNEPSVTVQVLSVRPKQIYLLGEVAKIGPQVITPEMTPLQALAAAGGLTAYAKPKNIYILRGEAGKQKKIPFNYKKALKDGDQQGVVLVPGDTIVVP